MGRYYWGREEGSDDKRLRPSRTVLAREHIGQLIVWPAVPRVAFDEFLICLGRFVQFSSYTRVVICRDCEFFSFAGVIA